MSAGAIAVGDQARSGDLLPPSRQGEKNTASQDQARKSSADDGAWDN
jgi:hypothetical protein